MKCEKCGTVIAHGDEKNLHGEILCEDCCMDLLSPLKACDPWAVYSAQKFKKSHQNEPQLTMMQHKIMMLLQEEGPSEPEALADRLQTNLSDLERDLAVLRHMEKIRGELRNGKRLIRVWS